jgi:hypothetical protein
MQSKPSTTFANPSVSSTDNYLRKDANKQIHIGRESGAG